MGVVVHKKSISKIPGASLFISHFKCHVCCFAIVTVQYLNILYPCDIHNHPLATQEPLPADVE